MGDNRILLYITLFILMYLLWAQWQVDYAPAPPAQSSTSTTAPEELTTIPDAVPVATDNVSQTPQAESPTNSSEASTKKLSSGRRIHVVTDVFELQIDTRGGDIRDLRLRKYAEKAETPDVNMTLLSENEANFHIAQSGLVSIDAESAPTHNTLYETNQFDYRLNDGVDELQIPLFWTNNLGVKVSKTYTFKRGQYVIDVDYSINTTNNNWSGSQYMQLVRKPPTESNGSKFIYTYTGGVVYNDEIKYEKVDFDDIAGEDLKLELKDGWLAMIQHYFLAAWIPDEGNLNLYYSRHPTNTGNYILGSRSPAINIKAGEQANLHSRIIVGPKLQYMLEEVAPGLDLTVDYGALTIIAKPLFWLLDVFHGFFGNWGVAIILLTLTVKAVFYKLSETSYKSMAKMRKVAPRIKAMKEKFGDDRQAFSKAMMDLYKKEKINPMGGCFPILIQIPVFISLYWVLLESVEMRHAPFALWITNLSAKDPYYILPLVMGITMYIQQKLNPAPIDPIQAKMFQIMPFVFTIFFAFFPSGLVLYWVVNNILSIIQQWIITKRIAGA